MYTELPTLKDAELHCANWTGNPDPNRVLDHMLRQYWRQIRAEMQEYKCCWCDETMIPSSKQKAKSWTLEHLVPIAHGGKDDENNYAASCFSCNEARGAIPMEDFLILVVEAREKNVPIKEHSRMWKLLYDQLYYEVKLSLEEEGYERT